jgi:hypothetical protein
MSGGVRQELKDERRVEQRVGWWRKIDKKSPISSICTSKRELNLTASNDFKRECNSHPNNRIRIGVISILWLMAQLVLNQIQCQGLQYRHPNAPLGFLVWAVIHAAFGLLKPRSMRHIFGQWWLMGFIDEFKFLVLFGIAAICWSLWLTRNAFIFVNKQTYFLRFIFTISCWLCIGTSFRGLLHMI